MKAYKGFNKDMTCRGFQYEEGKEYTTDTAELCSSGFHACENPLDCFGYYNPGNSVFHEVELDATDDISGDDSKRVGKRIKIGARLDVAHICKAHFEYVKEHTTCEEQGNDYANLSAQDWSSLAARNKSSLAARNKSSLAAQDWSSLAAQDWSSLAARNKSSLAARNKSSLAAQDWSSLSAGKNSVLAAFNSKAKAGIGSLIALATREWVGSEYKITGCKAAVVDGITLKPDTWYTLKDGEFVEVDENE
jgi:hypothetical protein